MALGKLFRVLQVQEAKGSDGSLGASITAIEYNETVYDDNVIQDYIPADNSGISDPTILGTPDAPVVSDPITTTAIPSFVLTTLVPVVGNFTSLEYWYAAAPTGTPPSNTTTFRLWETQYFNDGPVFVGGSSQSTTISGLPASGAGYGYYFRVRACGQTTKSLFSDNSDCFVWAPNPTATIIGQNFQTSFQPSPITVGQYGNGAPDLANVVIKLYGLVGPGQVDFNATQSNAALGNSEWRVDNANIVFNGITIGDPTDGGTYALWPAPTALTANVASMTVPIVFKDSLGDLYTSPPSIININKTVAGQDGARGIVTLAYVSVSYNPTTANEVVLTTSFDTTTGYSYPINQDGAVFYAPNNLASSRQYNSATSPKWQYVTLQVPGTVITGNSIANTQLQPNTITGDRISGNTITGNLITGNTITGNKIVGNTITGNNIAGTTITGDHIVGNTITGNLIAGNTITGVKIAGNTITGNNIAGNTITGVNIAADTITGNHITSNTIATLNLKAGTIDANVVIANTSITTKLIALEAIVGNLIANGTITTPHLSAGNIDANTILANYSITTPKLMANSIVANAIAANAITAIHIQANAITAGKIDTNAVTSNTIAAYSITTNKMAAYSIDGNIITANTLNGNAITTNTLDGNVIKANTLYGNVIIANTLHGNAITTNTLNGNTITANSVTGNVMKANTLYGNAIIANTLHGNAITTNTLNGNVIVANTVYGNVMKANTLYGNAIIANTMTANTINGNAIIANTINGNSIIANTINGNSIIANTISGNAITANTIDASKITAFTLTSGQIAAGGIVASSIAANTITFENLVIGAVTQSKSTLSEPTILPQPFYNWPIPKTWPDNTRCISPSGGVTIIPSTDPRSSGNTQYQEGSRIEVGFSAKFHTAANEASNLIEIWKSGASSVYDRGFNTIRHTQHAEYNGTPHSQYICAYGYGGLVYQSTNGGTTWTNRADGPIQTITGALSGFSGTGSDLIISGTGPKQAATGAPTYLGDYATSNWYSGTGELVWGFNYPVSYSFVRTTASGTENIPAQSWNAMEFAPYTGGYGNDHYTSPGHTRGFVVGNSGMIGYKCTTSTNAFPYVPGQDWQRDISNTLQNLYSVYSNKVTVASPYNFTSVAVGGSGTILVSSRTWASNTVHTWLAKSVNGLNGLPLQTDLYGVAGDDTVESSASKWVAVGEYSVVMYSADNGEHWTQYATPTATNLNAVRYCNGTWVAVGDGGVILSSTNGTTWTQVTSGTTLNLFTIDYSPEWNTINIGGQGIILHSSASSLSFSTVVSLSPTETMDLTRLTWFGSNDTVGNSTVGPAAQQILNNQVFSGTVVDTAYSAGQETTYYLVIGNMAGETVLAGQVFLQVTEVKR